MSAYRVFLSSTFADFKSERKRLRKVLPLIGVHLDCAEQRGDEGKPLLATLEKWIDECDMVVLLLGSRAGTTSDTGERWTRKEVRYAFQKNKRVFAYLRETPTESLSLVDRDKEAERDLDSLLTDIKEKLAVIPRFKFGECCKLTAMVIRDVDRCTRELEAEAYGNSFVQEGTEG